MTLQRKTYGSKSAGLDGRGRRILIGFAEALSAIEVTWNLLDAGFRVAAFTRLGCRPPVRRIRNVELVELTPPEEQAQKTLEELQDAIRRLRVETVLPLDDASVWLCDAASSGLDVPIAGPTGMNAQLTLDKRLQLQAAVDAGFRIPATQEIGSVQEALQIEQFPVVLKPALAVAEIRGKLRRGRIHFCSDWRRLERAVRDWEENVPMLAQPFLEGTGEGLFGLAGTNGVWSWSAHRRIRMMNPQGSGSSSCRSLPITDQPVECAERMLKEVNWQGMFMIELLRDQFNQMWFMELNGRSWGSMALALRRGLEYPAWTVMHTLDPSFTPPPIPAGEPIVCRHLGREIMHLLMVLAGRKPTGQTPRHFRLRTFLEVCHVSHQDYWYNLRPGNALLFIEDALAIVFEKVFSRGKAA